MKNKLLLGVSIIALCACMSTKANAVRFYDTVETVYEGPVERLSELEIVSGVSKTVYNPERTVTRAEFAKLIVESSLKGSEFKALISDDAEVKFRDIDKKEWYYEYVVAAVNGGFMQGYDDGTFKPNKEISYAEISKMVTKALGHDYLVPTDPRGWQAEYVDKMYEYRLFDGTAGITSMEDKATRGNVAVIIWNMLTTNTWKMIYRNDVSGFSYVDSGMSLMEQKIVDHTYLLDATLHGFSEDSGYIYVNLNNKYYKLYDQSTPIYFSMIGGTTDVLLKRVEYPGKEVRLEVVGLSPDLGSRLITGTKEELLNEGYDLSNRKKVSENADYYYVHHYDKDEEKDRVVAVNLNNFYLVDSIKVDDKNREQDNKEKDKSHSDTPAQFEDDVISYRYKTSPYDFDRTININDGELVISEGAVLFKDNKKVNWSSLKKNDLLVEVSKDNYYFVISTTSKVVKLEEVSNKKDNYYIKTSGGQFTTYSATKYYDYIGNNAKNFNSLKDSVIKNLIGKNVEVFFDESGRVVKVKLLEDDVKLEEFHIGVYSDITYIKGNKYNEISFIIDGKKKTYKTSIISPKVDPGEFVTFRFKKNTNNVVESVTKVNGAEKLSDNLSLKTFKYNDLKNKIKYYDEEKIDIQRIKYSYDFGKYDEPSKYEFGQISLKEFVSYDEKDIDDLRIVAVVDSNGGILQVFIQDYTDKNVRYYGMVNKLYKESDKQKVLLTPVGGKKTEYTVSGACNVSVGDFVKYSAVNDTTVKFGEKYTTKVLGYFKDLIIGKVNVDKRNKILSYDLVDEGHLDVEEWNIIIDSVEYKLDDYDVFLINLKQNENTQEYYFSSVELVTKSTKLAAEDRLAINEIEGSIIIYRGYSK